MSNKISHQSLLTLSILSGMMAYAHAAESQQNKGELSNNHAAVQLEKIVVTASGFEQDIKKAAASISVLTQEEINKKAYRDVTDALKDVPGVVVTGGGSSSDISIRGMGSAYTVIMVDGKKINTRSVRPNSDNSGIEQGWLPNIGAIERIEVIRGPMSGLYGSDAMGGVINIITKKTGNEWQGSIKLDTTLQEDSRSGNMYQSNVYLSGPLIANLLSFKANGLFSQREEDEIYGGYNKQKIRAGGAALSLTPNDDHTVEMEYQRSIQNRDATVGKTISPVQTGRNPPVNSLTDYYRTEYNLTHRGQIGAVETHSYIQREENDNPSRNMEAVNTTFNTLNKINLNQHSLSFGGMYLKEELDDKGNQLSLGGATPISSLDRYSWALFAEDAWNIVDDFTLTSSLRLDKDEKFGDHWSPKVYGVWGLNDHWVIKGGVSTGYKTPALRATVAEWGQATGGGQSKGVIVGNPELKPEKSINYEVSFNWDNLDNLNAGLTLFNSEFKDKITEIRTCQGASGSLSCDWLGEKFDFVSLRENVDKANMRGAEATLGWKVLPNVNLSANYTFTDTEQKSGVNKGKPLNEMPKHMFNTTADWEISDQFSSWGRVNYRSKTSDYLSRTAMAKGKPAYTLVDVGLNYKPTQNIAIAAGVYNLFDKEIDTETYSYVLDGRRYNLGVTYSF
ncbi:MULTISPECIES: ligand-gated channel protein [unclassified Acinetobacter]|uniref:ligand-gated channel protein n=1 Tax=unclassified Acinetobacter TaxID=196816 RepID=UPI00244B07F9|nr:MULTISPECIES: ligand-gated channel protein [unclassified Acinetobacter]MDH0030567.1 ligand-gated channel protein [Acinetobacter sp. GD04021]MDH0885544.1 ligand-gated channel protein [Acinetobacter sp. GD03873]MDH1082140.1 ligand-gated channel protein [Acinetobacter sp. GD03983]MDH2188830.1 ligand-gated channel protein [Acinetobacter sp. GD03645]MDH2202609.1 ligand-gated channel protein [Acinetobacter sp. GD03647]